MVHISLVGGVPVWLPVWLRALSYKAERLRGQGVGVVLWAMGYGCGPGLDEGLCVVYHYGYWYGYLFGYVLCPYVLRGVLMSGEW